jgi:hypothetical protein
MTILGAVGGPYRCHVCGAGGVVRSDHVARGYDAGEHGTDGGFQSDADSFRTFHETVVDR